MILGFLLYFFLPFLAFVGLLVQSGRYYRLKNETKELRATTENAPWQQKMKQLREWSDTAQAYLCDIAVGTETGETSMSDDRLDDALALINSVPVRLGREGKQSGPFTLKSYPRSIGGSQKSLTHSL